MRKKDSTAKPSGKFGGVDLLAGLEVGHAEPAERRRLSQAILAAGVLGAALVFIAVFWWMRHQSPAPPAPPLEEVTAQNIIVSGQDASGRLNQLLVIAPQGGGYALYTLPLRTIAQVPGYGFQQLGRVFELGGQPLLDQTVADLLQLPIRYHISFDAGLLGLISERAGTTNFKTEQSLHTSNQAVALAKGDNLTGSARALAYLEASLSDGLDGPQIQALFYQGVHDSLATLTETDRRQLFSQAYRLLETEISEEAFGNLFLALTAGDRPFAARPLPVKRVGGGSSWYFEPLLEQVAGLTAGTQAAGGIRIEIRNGTSSTGVVEAAASRLAELRLQLTALPQPSGVQYNSTQIRCSPDAVQEANRVRDLLGAGTVIRDEYLEKQRIIVIMGEGDIRDLI